VDDRHHPRVLVTLTLLTALLVAPFAVAWARTPGGEPVAGHPGIAGFRQSAEVDRGTYAEDDSVILTYRVCRSRPWPTRTNSSFQVEFRVVDEAAGRVVADTTHRIHPLMLVPLWWWPGRCRTAEPVWDQHVWNQEPAEEGAVLGGPVRGDRVEPGSYRFEVWWEASAGGEPDEQVPDPIVTAPFDIVP
jgi:hypothetical protein